MTYALSIHKGAQKALSKAPLHIRNKAFRFLNALRINGTKGIRCRIKPLQGSMRKYQYYEALIDKDYRIIFRKEGDAFYIRTAGTHNELGTG